MSKIVVVIPFYNESNRIDPTVFTDTFNNHPLYDFLLVDDGSTDDTYQKLTSFSSHENVTVLSLKINSGKAEAIRSGVMNSTGYDYIAYFDADFSTPMDQLKRLIDFAEENKKYKIVMGARIKLIGNEVKRSVWRHYFGRVFATLISNFILATPVYDTQCGAKVIQYTTARKLFELPFLTRWLFDVELLLRLKKTENIEDVVIEIPLNKWVETGNTKIKLTEFLSFPLQLIKIYFKYGK